MKIKFGLALLSLFMTFTCLAQEVKIQELLDGESKLAMKKINDDLNKNQIESKVSALPKLDKVINEQPKIVEPFTVAVFGISPNYSGYMNFNGTIVLLKKGDEIFGRTVLDISKSGITLYTRPKAKPTKPVKPKVVVADKKVKRSQPSTTKFYPIVSR